jgi:hypothetical protein
MHSIGNHIADIDGDALPPRRLLTNAERRNPRQNEHAERSKTRRYGKP